MLAFDSITREVGAAGASCVDLFTFPGYSNDFICELFPDTGAIASQASYLPQNQNNARYRMRLGDNAPQLVNWLQANDVQSNPTVRQYGVIRMDSLWPRTSAFTGTNCLNYKSHRVGPNYTIEGNILLGSQVLDSMEARFKRQTGDLACKLMAAMQGAKMVGADSRCAPNGSSSLFAFLKVTQPTDTFGRPSFLISLKTHNGAGIEPIDSLQALFDAAHSCTVNTTGLAKTRLYRDDKIFPNPVNSLFTIISAVPGETTRVLITDVNGTLVYSASMKGRTQVSVKNWQEGVYFVKLISDSGSMVLKILCNPTQ
ncbi:MAG: DUF1028 domain-containing protein [bacterium]|nr:DUF1028 domain-containing protein [bacterium]